MYRPICDVSSQSQVITSSSFENVFYISQMISHGNIPNINRIFIQNAIVRAVTLLDHLLNVISLQILMC